MADELTLDWAALDPRIDALRRQGLPWLKIIEVLGISFEDLRARLRARGLPAPKSRQDEWWRLYRHEMGRQPRQPTIETRLRRWHKDHPQLTSAQQTLVRKVEDARDDLPWDTRLRLMRRAVRSGLETHPIVDEHRPFLRLYHGLGRPPRPLSAEDEALMRAVTPLLAQGLTLSEIHRRVSAKGLYTASRQALDKWLRRLGLWPARR